MLGLCFIINIFKKLVILDEKKFPLSSSEVQGKAIRQNSAIAKTQS